MGWLEKGTEAPFLQGLNQHLRSPPWEHRSLFNGQTSSTCHELHTLRGTEAPATAWITEVRAERLAVTVTRSLPCTRPLSRTQLADYLSVNRSAMTRELSKMRDEGIIDFDRYSITIK